MKISTGFALSAAEAERMLRGAPLRRLPGRNRTKADILVHRHGRRVFAVKDYSARPAWLRHTLGRYLVRREVAAYHAAGEVEGLPRCAGRLGPFALATEWIDAPPLAQIARCDLPRSWHARLVAVVERLHARGIALGDLHHRDVLVAPDGTVHVVDLATAWVLGPKPGRWRRAVFRRMRDQDRVALARLAARFSGDDVERAVDSVGASAARWHRRGRRLKGWLDRLRRRDRRRA